MQSLFLEYLKSRCEQHELQLDVVDDFAQVQGGEVLLQIPLTPAGFPTGFGYSHPDALEFCMLGHAEMSALHDILGLCLVHLDERG